jgi:hypothetical protein
MDFGVVNEVRLTRRGWNEAAILRRENVACYLVQDCVLYT